MIGMRSSELRGLEDMGWEENDLRELDGEVVIDAPFHKSSHQSTKVSGLN